MKILQLVNALTWGGAQILVSDLARAARRAGHATVIAAFRDGPLSAPLRREGFDVRILGEELFDIAAAWRLLALCREFRPDVIHSHLSRATFWARVLRNRLTETRLVTTIHGFESGRFHSVEKRMASLSDHILFPSGFLADWYEKSIHKLPPGRASVIYPGVETSTTPRAVRTSPGRPIRIGTLSRLHRVKGVDILLEACAGLCSRYPLRIVIGGDGKERGNLGTLAARLGIDACVEWTGPVSSPKEFLDTLDIFVAPSREEAFGITICEAMDRNLPVVASRVGGIPEIVRDGVDGLLVPPEDRNALARAIERLLQDEPSRLAMGISGNRRVNAEFRRKSCLDTHMILYHNILHHWPGDRAAVHLAVSSCELGGGERLALSLAQALRRRGFRITATCAGDPLAAKLRESGIATSVAPMTAGGLFFGVRLARDLLIHRPDLVSAHLNRAALASGLLRLIGGPSVISHVHGLNREIYYRFSDHLVAVSESVGEHLRSQGIPPERISVIPNRIPGKPMHRTAPPAPPWVVGIPAKLHANKGHRWAFNAIASNIHNLPDLRIEIFGDGPERAALQSFVTSGPLKGITTFHGFEPDMDAWYPKLHLVMLPSLGEGIPLSLIEPMRWGLPCIATNVGGIPEVVEDGANGVLVKPGDEAGLIDGLNRLLSGPAYESFRAAARAKFQAINDFEGMIDRFEHVCADVSGLPGFDTAVPRSS
ncbi:MAG TPA: glycosyltransferase [Candidatus Ozemobacteraceae bacterium]|nr:glycosyltransferase [Candidatus Ozemobacteraceae bacterium]HQG26961.1 glycosyltransferase [Candidatus Ozemobacteraceae bacterium]